MKQLIACCGLNCEACDARIATCNNDDALRERTAQLWSEINHVTITKEMINCMGCRTDGVKTPFCDGMCDIRRCVRDRGFATCGDCPDLRHCETVKPIFQHDSKAMKNLTETD